MIKNVGISFLKRSDLPFRKRAVYKTPVNDLPFWKDLQQMLDEIKHGNVTPYEVCFAIDLGPFIDTSLKDLERPWSSATAAIKKLIRRDKTPADSRGTIFGKRVEVRFMRESRKIYFVGL